MQQTLWRAWQGWDQFRGKSDAERAAWLRQILAKTLAKVIRDHSRARRSAELERSLEAALGDSSRLETWLAADQSSPSQVAERNEQLLRLAGTLAELPEPQQEVLLRHCHGWSLEEIGTHLGRTRPAVASLLRRGLKELRERLSATD